MTAIVSGIARRSGRLGRSLGRFSSSVTAVSIKELRGRMRGRRAFVVVTVYLLLLSGFAFAVYQYLRQSATAITNTSFPDSGFGSGQVVAAGGTALSAGIGHGIFGGLLLVETLLILVLAPALTSGAISIEREKQTLDMLVTTPLSSLGMVVGKLFSALTYVFLLIIASIPLASLVFVFGGVGPEDLVRAYVMLFALAFGMGAIGLFISALVKRTQTATVITFVTVLVLTIGSVGLHQFLTVATRPEVGGRLVVTRPHQAPEALLWLNPFVADLDLICTTSPASYHQSCAYISSVTRRPYFGSQAQIEQPQVGFPRGEFDDGPVPMPVPQIPQAGSLGFPRDIFWPKSAAAFLLAGIALTLVASQLVSPTRRLRIRRRPRQAVVAAGPSPNSGLEEIPGPSPEAAE